jgi:hypothetical protein
MGTLISFLFLFNLYDGPPNNLAAMLMEAMVDHQIIQTTTTSYHPSDDESPSTDSEQDEVLNLALAINKLVKG